MRVDRTSSTEIAYDCINNHEFLDLLGTVASSDPVSFTSTIPGNDDVTPINIAASSYSFLTISKDKITDFTHIQGANLIHSFIL